MGGGEEGEGNPDPPSWELDAQVEDLVWTQRPEERKRGLWMLARRYFPNWS